MRRPIQYFLLLLLFNQSCLAQQEVDRNVDPDSLLNYTREIMTEFNIPAMQVALVSGDKIVNTIAVGVNKVGGTPISVNSRMHLGSCGKAMTGYLAGILVARNTLRWDTKIVEVLPELKAVINKEFHGVTLRELLSHQARIPQFITDAEWKILDRFTELDPTKRRYDFTRWILQKDALAFDSVQTASGFRYSNAGYAIAATMLEKATGESWETLMTSEVFDPLGIKGTFGWPAKVDKSQPFGHMVDKESENLLPHQPNDHYQIDPILSPSGNISMSILDYAKFIQKNLAGLNGRDRDHDQGFYEFLHYAYRPDSEYSIGWYSNTQFDDELSSHTGSADTFYCLNILLRKRNFAVIVIANSATSQTKVGAEKIRNYLLRSYLTQ